MPQAKAKAVGAGWARMTKSQRSSSASSTASDAPSPSRLGGQLDPGRAVDQARRGLFVRVQGGDVGRDATPERGDVHTPRSVGERFQLGEAEPQHACRAGVGGSELVVSD